MVRSGVQFEERVGGSCVPVPSYNPPYEDAETGWKGQPWAHLGRDGAGTAPSHSGSTLGT